MRLDPIGERLRRFALTFIRELTIALVVGAAALLFIRWLVL